MSDKIRMFGRYSRWHSTANPCAPMGNGNYANDPYAPEDFTTTQGVLGVTYMIAPTLIFDVRVVLCAFSPYQRLESYADIDLAKTFKLPQYMNTLLPLVHSGPGTAVPSIGMAGYTVAERSAHSVDRKLLLTRAQCELGEGQAHFEIRRRLGATSRTATTRTSMAARSRTAINGTCSNALNCGASGNGMASMLLGFGSAYSVSAFSFPLAIDSLPGLLCYRHLADLPPNLP